MRYKNANIEDVLPIIRETLRNNVNKNQDKLTKGLFIYGKTGVGKTYTLHAIKNRLYDLGVDNLGNIENWLEINVELRDRVGVGRFLETIREITKPSIIFIDDVGVEKLT